MLFNSNFDGAVGISSWLDGCAEPNYFLLLTATTIPAVSTRLTGRLSVPARWWSLLDCCFIIIETFLFNHHYEVVCLIVTAICKL